MPVLQYLCPMFGDRVLDRDGNNETCLDIARRLGRKLIVEFLTKNYPQLEEKVRLGERVHVETDKYLISKMFTGHTFMNAP